THGGWKASTAYSASAYQSHCGPYTCAGWSTQRVGHRSQHRCRPQMAAGKVPTALLRHLLSRILAARVLVLHHRVELRAEQQHRRGQVEIHQQHDDGADAAVGGAVVGEILHVVTEAQGGED